AGPGANAADAGGGVALENRPILGERQPSRRILGGLPVGIIRAALHVIDLLAIELERYAQLDERFHLALPREDAVAWRLDRAQVAGSDGRKGDTPWSLDVDDAPRGEVALERARRLLLDLTPRPVGDRGELAVQVIHETGLL